MTKIRDFIIDAETLGSKADAIVVDISVMTFDPDVNVMESMFDPVERGKKFKFNLELQKGKRIAEPGTIAWWKGMPPEARKGLIPSDDDLTIKDGIEQLLEYLKSEGVNPKKSHGYCRGQSFDFPLLCNLIQDAFGVVETNLLEPVCFWNQRDIRTAIEAYSMVRDMTMTPLRKGILDGFVAHNSLHDCAKDIIMLKMAQRYAMGIEAIPEKDDIDPVTIKKR